MTKWNQTFAIYNKQTLSIYTYISIGKYFLKMEAKQEKVQAIQRRNSQYQLIAFFMQKKYKLSLKSVIFHSNTMTKFKRLTISIHLCFRCSITVLSITERKWYIWRVFCKIKNHLITVWGTYFMRILTYEPKQE